MSLHTFDNFHKTLHRIRPRIVRLFGLKHHVILILFSGQLRPLIANLGFFFGLVVVQMIALGLHHQHLPTVEHYNDVRVSMNRAVDLESQSGNIAMPPLDVVQLR